MSTASIQSCRRLQLTRPFPADLLVNIAFFAVVPKAELIESNRLVAALFIEKMFGAAAGRAISVIIALSAIGNVLAVLVSLF